MNQHRFLLSCLMAFCASMTAWSQTGDNVITVSGGYSFAKFEDYDTSATGWRINALYESNRKGEPLAHGVAVSFISVKASSPARAPSIQQADYTISTLPVYYAPKYMFGGESFKAFIKGALGVQFSWLSRTGGLGTLKTDDFGFYAGLGAGAMLMVSDNMFVNVEYEWGYMSNSYYRDGFMNSAMAGVGIRF